MDPGVCPDYDEYDDPAHLLRQMADLARSVEVDYLTPEDMDRLREAFETLDRVWDLVFERRRESDG